MSKYALITGGSRGIGKAVAKRLAKEGYTVVLNYQSNQVAAEAAKQEIESEGGQAELLPFDVSSKEAINQALDQWEAAHPGEYISALVNNAGIRRDNIMVFMSDEEWDKVVNTTMNGFFYITRRVVTTMVKKRNGRIINMASLSGLKGMPGQTNYTAAKAALIGATKALALEVAARKVTVNAIAPGFIATDMTKDLNVDELKQTIPMKRFGTAEEVAALVAFLASGEAAYITGQAISINGGLYT